MLFFEAVLNGFAILSTIVATLRAGSRVFYISEHGAIGLVDGPRIAPPPTASAVASIVRAENETIFNSTSETTTISGNGNKDASNNQNSKDLYNPALYELAENFKQCVKISSSSKASMDESSQHHGCENLFRDRPIADFPPLPTASAADPKPPSSADSSSPKTFLYGGLRQLRNQIRSFAEEQSRAQKKKDPFGNKAYTLGYARYAPKTFQENENKENDKSSIRSSTKSSVAKARAVVTEAVRATLNNNIEGPLDFGLATEADYYYNAVSASPDRTTKRRRVAQLKSYCPETFGDLRSSTFGISEEDYLKSVLGTMVSFQSNSKGAARSGGIFFFTRDGAYMIKTIPDREKKTLLKILPDYHEHMKRNGRSSLLTRFCGMYGITIEEEEEATTIETNDNDGGDTSSKDILGAPSDSEDGSFSASSSSFAPTGKEYTFVVMNAVFPAEASTFVSERFDLKGSTVGREVSREELESKGRMAVLKDLDLSREVDLVRSKQRQEQQEEEERLILSNDRGRNRWWGRTRRKSGYGNATRRRKKEEDPAGFTIGATAKATLLSQLRKDVQFLTKCQVMDYSLLVGVVNTDGAVGGGNSFLTPEIVETIQEQKKVLELLEAPPSTAAPYQENRRRRHPKLDSALLYTLTTPVRLMLSPPVYVARNTWNAIRLTIDSIVTAPMPYYGSGQCGVYGGKLAMLNGKRKGDRAVYYLGLIDFLQPWTTRKVMERKFKGLAGYDTNAISAVTPEEYATRFLEFLDKHIN
jgi:hypothetical protein